VQTKASYTSRTDDPTLQDPEQIPEQFNGEEHGSTLAYDYYASAYGAFLDGQDVFPEERRAIEERYGIICSRAPLKTGRLMLYQLKRTTQCWKILKGYEACMLV
jgi:hypothetical protein